MEKVLASSKPHDPDYDVVIVGARAAGAATAMLLARSGVRVLAVDRQAYGSDTLSTHALMRARLIDSPGGVYSMRCGKPTRR